MSMTSLCQNYLGHLHIGVFWLILTNVYSLICIFSTNKFFFVSFDFRKNIAECAIHVAYRIARHAILATCANHPVVILRRVVIHVIPVVVMYVVAIIDYIYATALTANFMSKNLENFIFVPFYVRTNFKKYLV